MPPTVGIGGSPAAQMAQVQLGHPEAWRVAAASWRAPLRRHSPSQAAPAPARALQPPAGQPGRGGGGAEQMGVVFAGGGRGQGRGDVTALVALGQDTQLLCLEVACSHASSQIYEVQVLPSP